MKPNLIKDSYLIPIAKLYFILMSYATYLGLARILGPELFGVYGIVIGIVSVINMVFITGTIQGVSKFVSEDVHRSLSVKRTALGLSLLLGGGSALLYFLTAPSIAGWLHDASLAPFMRLSSGIIFFYSLYAVFIGIFNGERRFKSQALFDMSYSTMKTVLILTLALIGWSVYGAVGGFVLASFVIFLICALKYGIDFRGEHFPITPIARFALTIMGFVVMANLIQQMDLLLLKALSPRAESNLLSGYYTAALTIARVPYMIISSLGFIIFPLVSQSTYQKKSEETRAVIRQSLRICLVLAVPVALLFSASSNATVNLLYPAAYLPAGDALGILAIAYLGLTVFMIGATIISGSGHPFFSFLIAATTLAAQVVLGFVLIPIAPLKGAALSTLIASGIGVVCAAIWIGIRFRSFVGLASLSRIGIAGVLIFAASRMIPGEGWGLIFEDAFLSLVYFGLLFVFRELTLNDFRSLMSSLGWKKSKEYVS